MAENWHRAGFGIYLHWPFCAAKCPYCDFNSHVVANVDQHAWADAFVADIRRYAQEVGQRTVSTVFFGGGTPSLMAPHTVEAILDEIPKCWSVAEDIEVTLEANPTSADAERLAGYQTAGVNRVSIGVQSLYNPDLKKLGRLHSVTEALETVALARKTFNRISFDLIYARQDQSLRQWQDELNQALSLAPDHLSLYQLTIEPGTAFGDRFSRGALQGLPDEDLAADMFEATQLMCEGAGLPAYETSNHAKPGSEGRHNLIYWQCGDYLGIGPGAHGRLTLNGTRIATETALSPAEWLNAANSGIGESSRTKLTPPDIGKEQLLMGLRLRDGIPVSEAILPLLDQEKMLELNDLGLIFWSGDHLALTATGRPILNSVLREIITEA